MKRFIKKSLSVLSLAFTMVASPVSFAGEREPYPRWPGLQDETYYVMGGDGRVFADHESEENVVPASTVKLMTLYMLMEALENGDVRLDDEITMSPKAANISLAYSQAGIRAWHFFDVDFALRSLFVYSANDVASSVGAHLSKVINGEWSERAFVKMMNEKAKELGMDNTVFKDASGINRLNKTTAQDMMLLANRFIADYPQLFDGDDSFLDYPSLTSAIRHGRAKAATNALVLKDEYNGEVSGLSYSFHVDGLKTGFTARAGFCLLASSVAVSPIDGSEYRVTVAYFGASDKDERNGRVIDLMETAYNQVFTVNDSETQVASSLGKSSSPTVK